MPDRFNTSILQTIARCRRLASITHDPVAAAKLRALADQLETGLRGEASTDEPLPGAKAPGE